ncbi:hypothetical protein [Paenibacillus kandeliae]|uniref:hypothetical protein n=1 Tax=Paenibacillus kandeliae TaxID=3231269 RepID=UPI0034576317
MDHLPSRRRQMSALVFSLILLLFCLPFQSADETDYDFAVTNGINPGNMSWSAPRHAPNSNDGNDVPDLTGGISLSVLFAGWTLLPIIGRTHLLSCIPLLLKRLLLASLKYRSNYMDQAVMIV